MVVGLGVGLMPVVPCVGIKGVVDLVGVETGARVAKRDQLKLLSTFFVFDNQSDGLGYLVHLKRN
jgi:hypothetical protein